MLVLKRNDGQWVDVVHAASGDTLRIRLYDVQPAMFGGKGRANLAFDDAPRKFSIQRPERPLRVYPPSAPDDAS